MTILELFEKVNLVFPIDQRRFFNYFNDSVSELMSLYGEVPKLLFTNPTDPIVPIKSLTDENVVLPLYHNSIVDNILFFSGQGDTYKGEFVRKSKLAYLKYWNDNAKSKKLKQMEW